MSWGQGFMNNMVVKMRGRNAVGPLMQIIIITSCITLFFLLIIAIHKKNKPIIPSEEEKDEQKKMIYEALKEIIRSDGKSLIDELSEKIDLREGDSPNGK